MHCGFPSGVSVGPPCLRYGMVSILGLGGGGVRKGGYSVTGRKGGSGMDSVSELI